MIAMGTDYWTQQRKLSERAWEEMSSSALRVQAFRSTLESYFIQAIPPVSDWWFVV